MLTVVLVGPQYPGNVGAVARAMLNFGVERLVMVNPCPVDDEARARAVHAQRVLDEARIVSSLAEVLDDFDYLVAFAARVSHKDKDHLRQPVDLVDFAPVLAETAARSRVALVFGPEDDGLGNEDIQRCDAVATIPTSAMYRSMNLSHAVTVALFAVATARRGAAEGAVPASTRDKELLFLKVEETLRQLRYPEHRVRVTTNAFRRLVGRAVLTEWEYHRVMGMFTRTEKFLRRTPPYWADEVGREDADPGADEEP